MEWIKNNIITLVILLFLGFLVFKSLYSWKSDSSEYKLLKQLDSAKAIIVEKNTENKALLKEKENAEKEKELLILNIKEQLNQIQPKYIKIMSNYNKASPEQKKEYINDEYERRKKEMEIESKIESK
jgi:hypothetical protein